MTNIVCFDGHEVKPYCETGKIVYHYTSPDSFLSVVKNKNLWFSDSQFMNDRSEYVHIKNIFKQAAKGTPHDDNDKFVDYLMGVPYGGITTQHAISGKGSFSRGIIRTRYYLFCISLDPDSHSMWNYYVKNGYYQGYNFGLSVDALMDSIPQFGQKLTHGKVNYNVEEQILHTHNKIMELSKEFDYNIKAGIDEELCIESYQEKLAEYLLQRCMFYKNPAFKHEEEYRFLIEAPAITTDSGGTVEHHVGGGGLIVPHLVVTFDPIQSIRSITLAPMMEPEVAKQGVQRLLANKIPEIKSQINIDFSQINVRF
ncbi:DUF2971 domain-containing protein [Desulfitobacterium metallireducens]|uniref:DUF2971 domain-containing protein n=1 Tax=Desulfitobacterium metallireducens DSM 15288 TaxID=871968 RepID=W0ECP7_9FIRM|nr:DUF2971 domain-containing protein [Desulfitobacterium metallireducens]AHF08645.1 hypothetical protein DESME_11710 [Desulfitobacterium metallireducens DSM 15288]